MINGLLLVDKYVCAVEQQTEQQKQQHRQQ